MATILVVDDRELNRSLLTTLLGYGGHRLLEASSGPEGLSQVQRENPELIITDILMPDMDGYEFVRKVRTGRVRGLCGRLFAGAVEKKKDGNKSQ